MCRLVVNGSASGHFVVLHHFFCHPKGKQLSKQGTDVCYNCVAGWTYKKVWPLCEGIGAIHMEGLHAKYLDARSRCNDLSMVMIST